MITTPAAITLTSGELLVNKSVTITGPGADQLSLSGNHLSRVFHIDDGKTVIISGLTITNGSAEKGAGIYNDGHAALTLDNCTLSGNSAVSVGGDAEGGGIFNNDQATLTLNNCTISGNSASASNIPAAFASGGGIFNSNATLTLDNCTVSGNSASLSTLGATAGGICNVASGSGRTAATTINNSTLRNNSAFAGGGIFNDAFSAFPAGSATLTINNSTLTGNSADQSGGIHIQSIVGSATVTINNSTLSGNSATGAPGGVFIKGSQAGLGGSTTVTIQDCTLTGNWPGGIVVSDPTFYIATVTIGNTILRTGVSGANLSGTITSLGYNLSNDDGGGYLTATGDQINTDPMLGPLQDNGSPTFTHSLLPRSPAIDKGKSLSGSTTDQRGEGFPRTVDNPGIANASGGDGTDIGAFEVQNFSPTANAGPDQTVNEFSLVTLDGTGSSEFYNDPLTYAWTQIAGTPVALSGANIARPSFTAPHQPPTGRETLRFSLTVTDQFGATRSRPGRCYCPGHIRSASRKRGT